MSTRKHILILIILFLASVSFTPIASAQSSTATLSGVVEDQNGQVIPNATVTLTDPAKGLRRTAATNDSGYFTFALLPASTYTLLVEQTGFGRAQFENIVLNVGDQKAIKVELRVGDVTAQIEVRPDETLVTTKSDVSTVIDRHTVENIPLNGRSFQSLFELTPGVVLVPAGGGTAPGQFSVNGQRTNANYVTVDGVGANTGIASNVGFTTGAGQTGSGTAVGYTAQGTTASLVSVDALQEFRIQTSTFAPEFGRMPGGQVSLVTRPGSNDFHGTLFESFRDDALDANDWFANRNGENPPLRQHQFGGTLGGPIVFPRFGDGGGDWLWLGKDKLFFFLSYEGLRLLQPRSLVTTVPSIERRQAAHPDIQPFINAFPIPNGVNLGNGLAEFSASWSDRNEYDATALRIDYNVASKHTVFGRYNDTPSYSHDRTNGRNFSNVSSQINRSFTAGSTWLPSKSSANDFRINYTETFAPFRAVSDTFGGAALPPNTMFGSGRTFEETFFLIAFRVPGFGSATTQVGTGTSFRQRQFNIVDGLTFFFGDHSVKFGVDYRLINPSFRQGSGSASETIVFNLSDVTLPRAFSYEAQVSPQRPMAVAFNTLSLYAQDSWKVTPRLTLSYGIRWEFVPPPHATEGDNAITLANINDPYGGQVHINPPDTPLWQTRYGNFAPRVGASYLLSNRPGQELVVRGGFGVFYDLGYGQVANAYFQYPFFASKLCPSAGPTACGGASGFLPFPLTSGVLAPPAFSGRPTSITTIDPDIELPFTYQWNLAVERSLGANQTLTVSYVGAEGRRLLKAETNRINLLEWPAPQTATAVTVTRNNGYSDYRALQFQYQRRMHKNIQALIAYTFGRSRDTASADNVLTVPGQRLDIDLDYGYSSFDIRHVLTGAFSFEIPKVTGPWFWRSIVNNWGLDTIFRARTGLPVSVTASATFNDPSFPFPETFNVRPNVVPGQPFWIDDSTAPGGRRLNRLAFDVPAPNTSGNLPRGGIRGFSARQIDISLRRDFPLFEKVKLRFRVEIFNIFNTPHFADPSGNVAPNPSPTVIANFGRSQRSLSQGLGGLSALYQIGGPRSVQLSAKLVF